MGTKQLKYGCVVEDEFSLRSPRMIEGDEHDTFEEAMAEAARLIREEKAEQISIVRCVYSKRAEAWVEKAGAGSVSIDARDCEWAHEADEDDEDDESAPTSAPTSAPKCSRCNGNGLVVGIFPALPETCDCVLARPL